MSSLVRKSAAVVAGASLMAFILSALVPTIAAQEPAGKSKTAKKVESKKSKSAPPDAAHRVPRYFGGLGLSDDQKDQIYEIEGRILPEIQELEKKADALRDRLMVECENVLTAPQRKALNEARKTAADRRKATAESRQAEADDEEEKGEAPKAKSSRKSATIE